MKRVRLALLLILTASVVAFGQPRFQWVRAGLGPSYSEVKSLGLAPNGDLYITGSFNDSLKFGGQTIESFGNYDAFLARYSTGGNIMSSNAYGGFDEDDARSVAVDNNGNVYLAGSFSDQASVAGQIIDALELGTSDIFLAKFNKMGIPQWVKVYGSKEYSESAPVVACDSLGNVYLGGGCGGVCHFDTKTYQSHGKADAFIAKISANGDVVWVQGGGGIDNDFVTTLSVSPNGDRIYAAGTFIGSVIIGGRDMTSVNSKEDFFVMAYNANGQPVWVKKIGHREADRYITSTTTKEGALVLSGALSGVTTFDTQTITANGELASDLFVSLIAPDGTIRFVKVYGDVYNEVGMSVCTDSRGSIYVGGYFETSSNFDGDIIKSNGGRDAFVARFFPTGEYEWIRTAGGSYDDEIRGVVVTPANIPYVAGKFDTRAKFGDYVLEGERYDDCFIAALECGPNTALIPNTDSLVICEGNDTLIRTRAGYPEYQWYVDGTPLPGAVRFSHRIEGLTEGSHTITVQVTDFYGCTKFSDTVAITVLTGLPVPVITRDGQDLSSSVTDTIYQYKWYREGHPISGANGPMTTVQGDGTYRVRISDERGCWRWSEPFVIGTTDVREDAVVNGVAVYPNPVHDVLTLDGLTTTCDVTMVNMLGQVVATVHGVEGASTIPMQPMAPGAYTLIVRRGSAMASHIVIKR